MNVVRFKALSLSTSAGYQAVVLAAAPGMPQDHCLVPPAEAAYRIAVATWVPDGLDDPGHPEQHHKDEP